MRELACDGGFAVAVERREGHDLVLIRRNGRLRTEMLDMDADAALVRRDPLTGAPSRVALFGEAARVELGDWIFRAEAAAEFRRTDDGWEVLGEGNVSLR